MEKLSDALPHLRLQLNTKCPKLEDCWMDGYEAAQAGVEEDDNPFESDSNEHEHWCQGWWAGFYAEEPMYQAVGDLDNATKLTTQVVGSGKQAANESLWTNPKVRLWVTRAAKVAAIVAVSVACYELADLAI